MWLKAERSFVLTDGADMAIRLEESVWGHMVKVHTCDDCGCEVIDLENAIYVEWWSEDRCGCFKRGE